MHRLRLLWNCRVPQNAAAHLNRSNGPFSAISHEAKCAPLRPNSTGLSPNSHKNLLNTKCPQTAVNSQAFHTSSRNHIPPFIWLVVKPLAKVTSIITGRSLRKWWRALPSSERKGYLKALHFSRHRIAAAVAILLTAAGINYVSHIQETPITHRKRYIAFTPEQFQKILDHEYETQMETYKDKIVSSRRVVEVAQRIVDGNQDLDFMKNQKWTVIVIDSPEENAFVLPDGHIFVFTGLLRLVQNDDQLAVVIGHEMAHALLGHGAEQVSFAQVLDVIVIFAMAAIWFFMPTDGIAVVTQWFYNKVVQLMLHMPYSRKLEAEADEVGLELIAKACFDVRESSNFWDLMSLLAETKEEVELPEWLSTHPSNVSRAETLEAQVPKALEMRTECKCADLGKRDPRLDMLILKQIIEDHRKISKANAEKEAASQTTASAAAVDRNISTAGA